MIKNPFLRFYDTEVPDVKPLRAASSESLHVSQWLKTSSPANENELLLTFKIGKIIKGI